MSAALFMRLKARHQCPKTYVEYFVAHALQYDAQSMEYIGYDETGTYIVTVPDNIKVLKRMVERVLHDARVRG